MTVLVVLYLKQMNDSGRIRDDDSGRIRVETDEWFARLRKYIQDEGPIQDTRDFDYLLEYTDPDLFEIALATIEKEPYVAVCFLNYFISRFQNTLEPFRLRQLSIIANMVSHSFLKDMKKRDLVSRETILEPFETTRISSVGAYIQAGKPNTLSEKWKAFSKPLPSNSGTSGEQKINLGGSGHGSWNEYSMNT